MAESPAPSPIPAAASAPSSPSYAPARPPARDASVRPRPAREPHPPDLVDYDRPYFVPWGRRDMAALSVRIAALAAVVALIALVARAPLVLWLELPLGLVWASAILFFRNPRRRVPAESDLLLAPADGRVSDVEQMPDGEYIGGPSIRVGIFLSIFSVHVNRSPETGMIEYLRYRPGKFFDARDPRCATENESQTIGLRVVSSTVTMEDLERGAGEDEGKGAGNRILVRQISGAIARRILCPLVVGHRVMRGGLIGMIKYGSRSELWVPADGSWEVLVRPGDTVRAGQTALFRRRQ